MKTKHIYWILTFLYCSFIFYLSSKSKLPDTTNIFSGQDKIMHAGAYFILGVLSFLSFYKSDFSIKKSLVYSLLFSILYGLSDEIHQSLVPGRDCSFLDLLADSLGAFVGALFCFKVFL